MKSIYYYIPASTLIERKEIYEKGMYRGELAYGAFQLVKMGIRFSNLNPLVKWYNKFNRILYVLYLLLNFRKFDIIYSPYYSGLEYLIKLRGLGLFPRKIVVWQHSPIDRKHKIHDKIHTKLFIKGCDALCFFSEEILNETLENGYNIKDKAYILNWGPDMDFYDKIRQPYNPESKILMSGRDSRDFGTLSEVVKRMPNYQFVIIPPNDKVSKIFLDYPNVTIKKFPSSYKGYYDLSKETSKCTLILILSKPVEGRKLPSGLTSICEATGLAKPCIITENKYFSKTLRNAGFAKFVPVGDVDNICNQINLLMSDKLRLIKMSDSALNFAQTYDISNMSNELVKILTTK